MGGLLCSGGGECIQDQEQVGRGGGGEEVGEGRKIFAKRRGPAKCVRFKVLSAAGYGSGEACRATAA